MPGADLGGGGGGGGAQLVSYEPLFIFRLFYYLPVNWK